MHVSRYQHHALGQAHHHSLLIYLSIASLHTHTPLASLPPLTSSHMVGLGMWAGDGGGGDGDGCSKGELGEKAVRFVLSIRSRHPTCVPALVLIGHQSMAVGQRQAAVREYLRAYKQEPENPLLALLCG